MAKGIVRALWNRAKKAPQRIVLPEGEDPRTAKAARILLDEGIVTELTVLGDKPKVDKAFKDAGVSHDGVVGIDPVHSAQREAFAELLFQRRKEKGMTKDQALELMKQVLYFGAAMLATGQVDGDVAGANHTTGDVIRAALHMVGTAPGVKTVSGAFLMEVPDFMGSGEPKLFIYADSAVIPDPTVDQLVDIAVASARSFKMLTGEEPKVAMLSFSTKGSAEHPKVDKVRAATAKAKQVMGEDAVDGELQADAALVASVGARKCPGSPIAGKANVLVFPDLDSGNICYKITQRLAKAEAIGPLLQGVAKPVYDLSRGATAEDIATVAAIAAINAATSKA